MMRHLIKDRRRFDRWITVKNAFIIPGRGESMRCITANWGAGGALLEMENSGNGCPGEAFRLLIGDDDMLISCAVAHRTDGKIGVRFVGAAMRASRFGILSDPRAHRRTPGLKLNESAVASKYRRRT